ncbi:odorant receptor 43a-like [Xylocopa sonorina]|uniref:odorant receptor 43a-like n=1 Tax=Xylocopa sonorina TaxID=1818115 RepID=UPI00403AA92A
MVNASVENASVAFNVAHDRDYEYCIQVNRWLLKPIGVWPISDKATSVERLLVKLLIIACHTLMITTFVLCLLYIMFEEVAMELRMKAIGPTSYWLMGELNYCCLLTRSDDIVHCIEQIERDWKIVAKGSHREIMLKNARVGRLIACTAALCMHMGVFSYYITMGSGKTVFNVGNDSYTMYRLPCPIYSDLIDIRSSPTNEILLALLYVNGFVVNSITVGACGLDAVLALHACGQLNVVVSRIDDFVNTKVEKEEEKVAQRKLGFIVEHHLRTLSLVWYIERIMNVICLVQLVGCTANMCMLEYYILTENSKETMVSYGILYVSVIFNIFIFCYIGETITEQCRKVGEKVYMTEWYQLHYKTATSLVMIILRSSTVIKITAGKLVDLSIATFGDVFKTSFAYFNMLRTVAI